MKDFLQFLEEKEKEEVVIRLKCPKCAYMGKRDEFDMQSRTDDGMDSVLQPVAVSSGGVEGSVSMSGPGDGGAEDADANEVEQDGAPIV